MKTIIKKQTNTTPNIILDDVTNTLTIEGRVISLDSELFWSFIMSELKGHKLNTIRLKMEYINTASINCLLTLLKLASVNIVWEYMSFDEDMFELGQLLKTINSKKFDLVEINHQELSIT